MHTRANSKLNTIKAHSPRWRVTAARTTRGRNHRSICQPALVCRKWARRLDKGWPVGQPARPPHTLTSSQGCREHKRLLLLLLVVVCGRMWRFCWPASGLEIAGARAAGATSQPAVGAKAAPECDKRLACVLHADGAGRARPGRPMLLVAGAHEFVSPAECREKWQPPGGAGLDDAEFMGVRFGIRAGGPPASALNKRAGRLAGEWARSNVRPAQLDMTRRRPWLQGGVCVCCYPSRFVVRRQLHTVGLGGGGAAERGRARSTRRAQMATPRSVASMSQSL
jgi:hypothetical protein